MKKEKILNKLIMGRRSTRNFTNKQISKKEVEEILGSAIWAPCPHGFQPWKFVVIDKNSKTKEVLMKEIEKKLDKVIFGLRTILANNIKIMKEANKIIAVFNTQILQKKSKKLGNGYKKLFETFEIQAIAASIQNILLVAFSKRISSLWIGLPLIFKDSISVALNEKDSDLMALILLGYCEKIPSKTKRIGIKEKMRFAV